MNTSQNVAGLMASAEPIIKKLAASLLRGRTSHQEDAEQECRVRLLESLPRFDPAKGDFTKWVGTIAFRVLIDFKRALSASHRQAGTLPDDLHASPDDQAKRGADKLIDALMRTPNDILGKRKGHLFQLFILTEDRAELSDILGISPEIADQRICRLRKDLRALVHT